MAVGLEPSGASLPLDVCSGEWRMVREFKLSVQEPVPAAISPEPVIRGIRADGYFVWNAGNVNKAVGTSQ